MSSTVRADATTAAHPPAPSGPTERTTGVHAKHPPTRVLIVDDNRDAAEMTGMLLAVRGMEVAVAFSGEEALALARLSKPDVAFLDLGMPQMDGCALARRFRDEAALQGVRLVALTGWGAQSDRDKTASAGFDLHLVKPAALESLEAAIDALLARRA